MSKVLFIVLPQIPINVFDDITNNIKILPTIPMGVLSIASYLSKNDENVENKIYDFNVKFDRTKFAKFTDYFTDLKETIETFKPDIIGISAIFNSTYAYLELLSEFLEKVDPNIIVIAGGGLPSNLPKEVLTSCPRFNAVCYCEGEIPILELVKAKDRLGFIKNSDAFITLEKIKTDFQPKAQFVENIDEIPIFDMSLIDYELYKKSLRTHLKGELEEPRTMPIMSSRGCPYKCSFCASHSVHGRKVRLMSAKKVLEEIDYFIKNYGVNYFYFEDDHFFYDKERAIGLLNSIAERNVTIEFPNGVTTRHIDDNVAIALKKAGVTMVTLAIESGSDFVLKNVIHKPLNLDIIRRVVKILRAHDFYIRTFFIVGFPREKKEHRLETYNFIKEVGFNWAAIMIATPIVGSDLYKECKDNNYLINSDFTSFHYEIANITTPDFTAEEIQEERYKMNLDVNFINNYDIRTKNYKRALIAFKDLIVRVPEHAFAHYCACICYKNLADEEKMLEHRNKLTEILEKSSFWKKHFDDFGLSVPSY